MNDPSIELGPPPFLGEHLIGPPNNDDWDNFRARVDHWLSKARNIMRAEVEDYEIPILPVTWVHNPTAIVNRYEAANQVGALMATIAQLVRTTFMPASASQSQTGRSRAPSPIVPRSPEYVDADTAF